MKKSILTFLLLAICTICFGQSKKHITKAKATVQETVKKLSAVKQPKIYSLVIQVDSAGYIAFNNQFGSVFNDLDKSTAPHNEVEEDKKFLIKIYDLFGQEKKSEDAAYKAKQDSISKSKPINK